MAQSAYSLPRAALDLDGPSAMPPPGVMPVLVNPPNGNYIAIPVMIVGTVLSAIFYLIRFYAKFLSKKLNVADYLTIVSFPLLWVYIYYSFKLTWTTGYLVHQWNIAIKDVAAFSFLCWLLTILYLWIIGLVKCSILLEWTHIFVPKGTRSYFAWVCYATCGCIAIFTVTFFIIDMVNCTPFERSWDPLAGGFCRLRIPPLALGSAIVNVVMDMVPLILAQRVIWSLKLPMQKKLGVSLIFLIGILGCVSSITRLAYAKSFYSSQDTAYFFSVVGLCSFAEITCANLILCVPCVPKVLGSVKQNGLFTKLKSYVSSRQNTTKASFAGNSHFGQRGYEMHHTPKSATSLSDTDPLRTARSQEF